MHEANKPLGAYSRYYSIRGVRYIFEKVGPYILWVAIFYWEGELIFESYICGSLYLGWLIVGVDLYSGGGGLYSVGAYNRGMRLYLVVIYRGFIFEWGPYIEWYILEMYSLKSIYWRGIYWRGLYSEAHHPNISTQQI